MTKRTIQGVIRGKTIELVEDLGAPDGQSVEVQLTFVTPTVSPGEGLRRCAGALAGEWTDEDDRILEEIHQDRKRDPRRELTE